MIPEDLFCTDEIIRLDKIGVGDEISITGLFAYHQGQRRNAPIVRIGNIAALPDEQVKTRFGPYSASIDAYLIEARSIGGLSGSPVFVHLPPLDGRRRPESKPAYLLGLMHGHWDVNLSSTDAVMTDSLRSDAVNVGIGIVVPAKKILELINGPELMAKRNQPPQSITGAGTST